jgi:hypothetical protein
MLNLIVRGWGCKPAHIRPLYTQEHGSVTHTLAVQGAWRSAQRPWMPCGDVPSANIR